MESGRRSRGGTEKSTGRAATACGAFLQSTLGVILAVLRMKNGGPGFNVVGEVSTFWVGVC